MTEPLIAPSPIDDQRFPLLTPTQVARMGAHGRRRTVVADEILVEAGDPSPRVYVVIEGRLDVVRSSARGYQLVTSHRPGQFSGELSTVAGRRAVFQVRAGAPGEVIELDRDRLMDLVRTDAELSEILMRAYILRRVGLVEQGIGDAVVVGSRHSPATLRLKGFLTRNGHPYTYLDLDADPDVQALMDRFHVGVADIPVLICRGDVVLRNPSNQEAAECLGLNAGVDPSQIRDVVIIGAGPAGLAAAVYAASEGLDALVLEASAPGGQAGSSSKIENYLGFPAGISGQELATRAYSQAQKFGAQLLIARDATRLVCDRRPYAVELDGGQRVLARTIVIASGAQYRRLALENLARFEGAGVYYVASFLESQLCRDEEVIVVGGANSAGQAAVFLAQVARHVHILVRGAGLADTMSRYLVHRIEQSPSITLHAHTEIVGLDGGERLERVRWRGADGAVETRDIGHVFSMTGAVPSTKWLEGCVALDGKGFVRTGPALTPDALASARWPLTRPPYLLETSVPGVFAVGDVRADNLKRVAPAVGEGSMAVSFVHQVLHE